MTAAWRLRIGEAVEEPGGSPEFGGGAGQIVFDSDRGGDSIRDLYLMNSDGYDVSRLTRGDANSFAGPWSPDGQRIVYTSYSGVTNTYIAVINADGSDQTTLSAPSGSDEGFPDWSPDGSADRFHLSPGWQQRDLPDERGWLEPGTPDGQSHG